MTIGERGKRNRAQDLQDHAGSVLRIDQDGRALPDNPWYNDRAGLPEIFTYGHRNPQGLTYDPKTGTIWLHEHGPRGGDEVNILEAGVNYGWPRISYGREYSNNRPIGVGTTAPGMEQAGHLLDPRRLLLRGCPFTAVPSFRVGGTICSWGRWLADICDDWWCAGARSCSRKLY